MMILKKVLPVILVLALIVGTMPIASAKSSLLIGSISHDSSVVKQESFTVSSSVTASNVAGTITVTVTLIDNTGGAVTITDAVKTLTFNTNATQNVQWTVTAGTAGTYSNPFKITATASDEGIATPKTSDTPLTIQERPVLEVTFTRDKTSVSAGDSVRLDFTIMNSAAAGAADATNVIATLTLPGGWGVTDPSHSLGTIAAGGGSESGYWIVSADSPASSNTLTLKVTSTLPGGTITKTVSITGPTPPPSNGGVSPGGGGPTDSSTPTGETSVSTEPTGEVKNTLTAPSADGKASVTITAGIIAKDAAGNPLTAVTVTSPSTLPASAPSGVNYVSGYAYNFGPTGATFSEPVTISITFDTAKFEGKTPVIHVYEAGAWNVLETTVVGNKATTKVTHFSTFVLFAAEKIEVTTTPTPTPIVTTTPTVMPTPTPAPPVKPSWGLIIGIIIAVVIVGAAAYYYYTKKKA
ncbi:MAG: hypothetical protein WBD09_11525 [Halobacteriota archaeon]